MRYAILGAAVVLADQATKHWVRAALPVDGSRPLVPGFIHLTHVHNTGAAFGLFRGQTPWLIAAAVLALGLAVAFRKAIAREPAAVQAGCALGLGGAAGNLIDRVARGYVTDFIDLRVWPVFNLADAAIVVGALVLAWGILTGPRTPEEKGREAHG